MDLKIKRILSCLESRGYSTFSAIKNLNHRPDIYYFRANTDDNQKVLIKISTNLKRNYVNTGSILRVLSNTKFPSTEIYLYEEIFKAQVIVTAYVPGKTIQKAGYKRINPRLYAHLGTFLVDHFFQMKKLNNNSFQEVLETKGETFFKEKLSGYLIQLTKDEKVFLKNLNEFLCLVSSDFRLLSSEYAVQHGDFYGSNIVYNELHKDFALIDWDSAMITSQYFDTATFIAKELRSSDLIKQLYEDIYLKLDSTERKNFNYQILIALIKEYKNLYVLPEEIARIPHLRNYKKKLKKIINNNVKLRGSKLILND